MTDPATDYLLAAQSLIVRLNAPAQAHSVWIKTEVDPKSNTFIKKLCVSVRPSYKSRITIPEIHDGIPVVEVPWPKGV